MSDIDVRFFDLNLKIAQDSVAVENALYADLRVLEAAAVGVPDERLGELVVAIVSLRPAYKGQITEEELISQTKTRFLLH